jgi:hypothetical protein
MNPRVVQAIEIITAKPGTYDAETVSAAHKLYALAIRDSYQPESGDYDGTLDYNDACRRA